MWLFCLFFFNDTATTEIYTLSLHDALPISRRRSRKRASRSPARRPRSCVRPRARGALDRKSTRLNSSHLVISYAVFCLKKKKYIFLATTTAIGMLIYVIVTLMTTQN